MTPPFPFEPSSLTLALTSFSLPQPPKPLSCRKGNLLIGVVEIVRRLHGRRYYGYDVNSVGHIKDRVDGVIAVAWVLWDFLFAFLPLHGAPAKRSLCSDSPSFLY